MSNLKVTDEWLYQYVPVVDQALIVKLESEVDKNYGFSTEFRKKMRKLIEDEKRNFFWIKYKKAGKRVAGFVLILFLSLITMTMSVEAFRTRLEIFSGLNIKRQENEWLALF